LGIRSALFGLPESFVPADSVEVRSDRLVTPFTKDEVKKFGEYLAREAP